MLVTGVSEDELTALRASRLSFEELGDGVRISSQTLEVILFVSGDHGVGENAESEVEYGQLMSGLDRFINRVGEQFFGGLEDF